MKQMRRTRARRYNSKRRGHSVLKQFHEPAAGDRQPLERADLSHPPVELLHNYPQFYDVAAVGFYTLDRRGRILELNDTAAHLLGFPPHWLLGRSFIVFIAQTDVQRFLNMLRESARSPVPGTLDLDLDINTRLIPVRVSVMTSTEQAQVHHHVTVVDITEIRTTETLLKKSLANWYSLVHNAPDTILTVDANGRIDFVNKATWGYSPNALSGASLLDLLPAAGRRKVGRSLERAFRLNKRTHCDISVVDGAANRWYQFSFGAPHPVSEGSSATTTLMIREISEHKRTEQSLRASGKQLRDFAARIEAAREEERTRLARELHDELGQALTALKLDLSWTHKTARMSDVRKKMKMMIAHVDDTIERVRRISSELRPSILDDLGLIPAIEWQVAQFRKRTRIRTELVSTADSLNVSRDAAVAVFRAVQEALTNVMRHANATKVRISLELVADALRVSIVDNGIGISRKQEVNGKSLGIVGMKERIARLDGDFNIISEPGRGTRLDIKIPASHD